MGVLGLAPFLQRTCPEAITTLSDRLRGLSGKTIVLDGTLITQRLHWAPSPHRHKHLLGWYRLVTELRENNVKAICVFDGKQRTAAKAPETERRQRTRRLHAARSTIELDRFRRLHKIDKLLKIIRTFSPQERLEARRTLKYLLPLVRSNATLPLNCEENTFVPVDTELYAEGVSAHSNPAPECVDVGLESLWSERTAVDESEGLNICSRPPIYSQGDTTNGDDRDVASNQDLGQKISASPRQIYQELVALYRDYQMSRHSLLHPTPFQDSEGAIPHHLSRSKLTEEEFSESKMQQLLSREEGQLWLAIESAIGQAERHGSLSSLADRSELLSQNYERRNKPPSSETYEESKLLLKAMGLPCIECEGPYEAEALASSLVLNGFADYVASEDTDVLIYEAPMLRNITNRRSPLVIIAGVDVRHALKLSRSSYIDFALLLGTDFTRRIKHVGPARALKFIRSHGCIEHVFEREARLVPRGFQATYLSQIESARLVFNTLPPVPDSKLLEVKEVDKGVVGELLSQSGLSRAVVDADWDPQTPLSGNFFGDDPLGEGSFD